jgi:rhodanese-related sulfurtransferase
MVLAGWRRPAGWAFFEGKEGIMRRLTVVALVGLGVALSAVALRAAEQPKPPEKYAYPDVSIGELKAAIEKKQVTLIDANGTDSFKDGHIPGAIDFEASADKLEKLLPKDKDALVVAYCGGPQCMAYKDAAKKATELGYRNVKHLSAGISGWKSAGQKVETAKAG